jgi:two-component system response regulator HydG
MPSQSQGSAPTERSSTTIRERPRRERGRVLVVEDDAAAADTLVEALRARGFEASSTNVARTALARLDADDFEVVLTDLRMPEMTGVELAQLTRAQHPLVPVVVITAFGSIRVAVDAIHHGAYDFLTKPYDLDLVVVTLDRAIGHHRAQVELEQLRASRTGSSTGVLARSASMQRVLSTVARVAKQDVSVLITGESGTGKELIARALHDESPRSKQPFVALNCAAVPEGLLESELFGHVKGAFTDAHTARNGVFVQAHRGTLFLDEIGDMPLSMQAKLLRALQERRVRPVGGDREIDVGVRVIAATHRDLEADVAAGRFREDLFFRIHVVELALPPLRARGGDIILLATEFARVAALRAGKPTPRITPAFADRLTAYDWPGNVRELQNCMERAVALAEGPELGEVDLPARLRSLGTNVLHASDDGDGIVPLDAVERRYILQVLKLMRGNKRATADALGLDRSTLYRKLEVYGEHERKSSDAPE